MFYLTEAIFRSAEKEHTQQRIQNPHNANNLNFPCYVPLQQTWRWLLLNISKSVVYFSVFVVR